MQQHSSLRLSAPARLAAATAATAVTACIGAGLLGAFHASSPPQWLPASPEVLADLARCDVQPARAEREQCRQQVVLRGLEPADGTVQLAAGSQGLGGAPRGRP